MSLRPEPICGAPARGILMPVANLFPYPSTDMRAVAYHLPPLKYKMYK
ncbi:hypothetical protein [uncultured Duncaniella sp.]|nr:hypothetical protein [uncultured Duncaniella sp.]